MLARLEQAAYGGLMPAQLVSNEAQPYDPTQ
jgi:hypothetical protein